MTVYLCRSGQKNNPFFVTHKVGDNSARGAASAAPCWIHMGGNQPLKGHLKATLVHTTGELLKAKQYVRAAELLHEAQIAYEQTGDTILGDILAAASQICLTCVQYQAEQEWYLRAREEVGQRERELEQLLLTILDLLGGDRASKAQQPAAARIASTDEPHLPKPDTPDMVEHLSLWQRIQGLLGT